MDYKILLLGHSLSSYLNSWQYFIILIKLHSNPINFNSITYLLTKINSSKDLRKSLVVTMYQVHVCIFYDKKRWTSDFYLWLYRFRCNYGCLKIVLLYFEIENKLTVTTENLLCIRSNFRKELIEDKRGFLKEQFLKTKKFFLVWLDAHYPETTLFQSQIINSNLIEQGFLTSG